jgi:hypothetical protein
MIQSSSDSIITPNFSNTDNFDNYTNFTQNKDKLLYNQHINQHLGSQNKNKSNKATESI